MPFALTGLVNFISLTQGGARFHVACPGLFSFARSGLRFDLFSFPLGQGTALSFVQEQFPFRDAVGVAPAYARLRRGKDSLSRL